MGLAECPPSPTSSFASRDTVPTVVWLRGEHHVSTAAALWDTMAEAATLDDADLVVDLSDVSFMGAATVGVLIRTRNLLQLRSRSLVIRSTSSCARRVLELCGLSHLLDLRPTDTSPMSGTGSALATWVAVPAADPPVRRLAASASPTPTVPRPAAERAMVLAGRRGP